MPYQSPIEENWPSYNERFPKHEWTRPDNGFVPVVEDSIFFKTDYTETELFLVKLNEIDSRIFDRSGNEYFVRKSTTFSDWSSVYIARPQRERVEMSYWKDLKTDEQHFFSKTTNNEIVHF